MSVIGDEITRAHHDSMVRTMQQAGKCPTTLAGLLGWLNRMVAAEAPAKLHRSGVEPDSVLGAPARTEAFRRYIEGDPFESDRDGYFLRPLAAAIATMGHTRPLAAVWIKAVVDGGYERARQLRGWSVEETEDYLARILTILWVSYKPDERRR
jgi:hypothetical protein